MHRYTLTLAFCFLVQGAVEVMLGNGATVEYSCDGDCVESALRFCAVHAIDGAEDCTWALLLSDGRTDALTKLALELPDSFSSVEESAALLARLQRRVASLEPFGQSGAVSLRQPHWNLAFSGGDAATIATVLRDWAALYYPVLRVRSEHVNNNHAYRKKLRVGLVSTWFCNSAVGRLTVGLFVHIEDRTAFEVHAIHVPGGGLGVRRDSFTELIDEAADFSHELPMDIVGAQDALESMQLDVLVFTDIGMEPVTYALCFGRFAPVQVVFWGHPTTSGVAESADYYLIMDGAEPDVYGQEQYSEQLVRLDTLGSFYKSNESGQLSNPGTRTREDYARDSSLLKGASNFYAAPQHCQKYHPLFDQALLGILERDPLAVLILRNCSKTEQPSDLMRRLGHKAAGRVIEVPLLGLGEYVMLFGGSHVALETFPFGGSITSLDAFEAGTPVVVRASLEGRPALTESLYGVMGISDCCLAKDETAYVELAVSIATDARERDRIRLLIEERRHLLFENLNAVREFEAFLKTAHRLATSQ